MIHTKPGRATHPSGDHPVCESQMAERFPAHDLALLDPSPRSIDLMRVVWAVVVACAIGAITVAMVVTL